MALDKMCSVYKKEKRIREIMSEFNCPYKKAVSMYVHPSPDTHIVNSTPSAKDYVYMPPCTIDASPSYSEVLKMPPENYKAVSPSQNVKKSRAKKKKKRVQFFEDVYADFSTDSEIDLENKNETPCTTSEEENKRREEYQKLIQDLLNKLKNIIFNNNLKITSKLKQIAKTLIECLTLVVINFCSGLPMIKQFFKYFSDG